MVVTLGCDRYTFPLGAPLDGSSRFKLVGSGVTYGSKPQRGDAIAKSEEAHASGQISHGVMTLSLRIGGKTTTHRLQKGIIAKSIGCL